jgi:hypothetical protein
MKYCIATKIISKDSTFFTKFFQLPQFQSCGYPDPAFQLNPDPDPILIRGFDDQKFKKKHTADEAFSPQKRTSSTSKN